jgi:hypothetical protein
MLTYLPDQDFSYTARILDDRRLRKQTQETLQIVTAIVEPDTSVWQGHPVVSMWRDHLPALVAYQRAVCFEWAQVREHQDNGTLEKTMDRAETVGSSPDMPPWLGNPRLHASHRSNLLRENPQYYGNFGWQETDTLPYVWPTTDGIIEGTHLWRHVVKGQI